MHPWLLNLSKRIRGTPQPGQSLPYEAVECLHTRDGLRLRDWLRGYFQEPKPEQSITLLLTEARKLGWDETALDKLEIFANYYNGNLFAAFTRSSKYLSEPHFDPDIFVIACLTLYHSHQFEDAYSLLLQAIARQAELITRIDYLTVSGLIFWATNHLKATKDAYEMGLKLAPDDKHLIFNAYHAYFELGDLSDFEKVRQSVSDVHYDCSEAALAMAYVELAQNHYSEGFRIMEQRYDMAEIHRYLNKAILDRPRWKGEALAGRTLLITAEQGLGDTIMMSRYFSKIGALTHDIRIECQVEALSLLTYNFPDLPMVPTKYGELVVKDFDIWVGSMSLPKLFETSCESVPGKQGYLRVPPDYSSYWQERAHEIAPAGKVRIGIAWSGQPTHRADRRRSLPTKMVFPLIESWPDICFFALQTKVPAERPQNLFDISEEMATLADTAALINEMDLIITVDTSVVHIAGAIGKPTWLLLPHRYEWRWGLQGESNCWYESVRVLRQPSPGAWAPVLSRALGRDLERYITPLKESI